MATSKPLLKVCLRKKADSGADAKFLDKELTRQLGVETEPKLTTLQVWALADHVLHLAFHHTKPLLVSIAENHQEWLSFLHSCSVSPGC